MQKIILENAVSTYPGSSKLNGRFCQLNNFANTAVLSCTAAWYQYYTLSRFLRHELRISS